MDTTERFGKKMTVLGVFAIILGMLAMLAPGLTGLSIAFLVGILVTMTGIIRMFWAFKVRGFGHELFTFFIGMLTLICGVAMLANPLFAVSVLTLVLVVYFILDGMFEIMAGFYVQPVSGWLIFSGVISILLGLLMTVQFPLTGAWAIGILFGIKMFFIGLIMVTGGSEIAKK
ncbi:MAG: DUF308 domain-containing protein [Legionellaceae bacterium]|nr:DUF308 domain-containing protein [Legionellaceae bacterium]